MVIQPDKRTKVPSVNNIFGFPHVKTYKYLPPVFENGVATHVDEVAIKLVFDPNRR